MTVIPDICGYHGQCTCRILMYISLFRGIFVCFSGVKFQIQICWLCQKIIAVVPTTKEHKFKWSLLIWKENKFIFWPTQMLAILVVATFATLDNTAHASPVPLLEVNNPWHHHNIIRFSLKPHHLCKPMCQNNLGVARQLSAKKPRGERLHLQVPPAIASLLAPAIGLLQVSHLIYQPQHLCLQTVSKTSRCKFQKHWQQLNSKI